MPQRRKIPTMHTFELCDKVEVKNGKHTLVGLFQVINVIRVPAIHPKFTVVLGFSNGFGHHNGRLLIKTPSNRKVVQHNFEFALDNLTQSAYCAISLSKFRMMEIGIYKIFVYLGRKKVQERAFLVHMEEEKEFTKKEISQLLKQPNVMKTAHAALSCPNCNKEFHFQINLNPEQPLEREAIPFPPNNRLRCPNDDFEIDLTGIMLTLKKILGRPPPPTSKKIASGEK